MTKHQSYQSFITKLAKQEQHALSGDAKKVLDAALKDLLAKVTEQAAHLTVSANKKTIQQRSIKAALNQILEPELAKFATDYAEQSVSKFQANKKGPKSKRAGLHLPVPRVEHVLRQPMLNVGSLAPVYLTAAAEAIISTWTESASVTRAKGVIRINPHHLQLALGEDKDLNKLFGDAHLNHGGVSPYIPEELLGKNKRKHSDEEEKKASKKSKN